MMTMRRLVCLAVLVCAATAGADDAARAAADAAFNEGRWADAARLLTQYTDDHPSDGLGWRRLAIADLELGDVAAAKRALDRDVKVDGRTVAVEFLSGRIASQEGDYDAAARAFSAVRTKDPKYEVAWTLQNLGYALQRLGRFEEARPAYRDALARPVAELRPRMFVNAAKNEIALSALPKALEIAVRGRDAFPADPWLADLHGWALSLSGDAKGASRAYARARELARSLAPAGKAPVVPPPMAGRLRVIQGPGGSYSHETLRNGEAADLVAVDDGGRTFEGDGSRNEQHACFDRPVVAAMDGDVVIAKDGVPDNRPGETTTAEPRGNHVYLRHALGLYTRYFHLRCGSVQLKLGAHVHRGETIGRCGNSGFSRIPHVCFAVAATPPEEDLSVPFQFGPCMQWIDGRSRPVDAVAPAEGVVVESAK